MDVAYPAGPAAVPENLTAPTRSYRRHAWLATGGLLLFVAVYFALAGWFGWTAYRLLSGLANAAHGNNLLGTFLAGAGAAFLAVFMLKALVFVKHGGAVEDIEITAADEPALFAFLYRLADEAGAPRPHRVYLSGRVNAGVFYDLSIANLLIPSRKNLEIGLALVNVLNLGELKAVLAHEFGHFAQRTMAVGRWVYIAQQIAGHIVSRRDALDAFLAKLSAIDLRIAWIGWVLRVILWSIRALVDLVFRIVVLAQRALSREMEFQADLVAVSLTGSDALIHALHKLGPADQAWDRTLDFANGEAREGRGIQDLFAIQTRVIEKMRMVLADPEYGVVPPVPEAQPATHRLFRAALAAPPRMWSTHPTSADRENNAKKTYVSAAIDERSAWTVFADPHSLRERITAHMARKAECKPVALDASLTKLEEQYTRAYLNPSYRGVYLGRSIVRDAKSLDELYGPLPPRQREALITELNALYPESLSQEVERLRSLMEEKQLLEALRAGFLTAPGGVIRHRGEQISRKALPGAIESVQREIDACAQIIRDHDRRCRAVHLSAAGTFGDDWAGYLKGLLHLLHYADHVEADLLDARGLLANTVAVLTAGGRVSNSDRQRVVHAADTAYAALRDIHQAVDHVVPDRTVLRRMHVESWRKAVEELKLPEPTAANIGQWLNAIDSWVHSAAGSLNGLRLAALEQLLLAEAQIARFTRDGLKPAEAPPASKVPTSYRLLLPGFERPRDAQLDWWDRFQIGSGILPTVARVVAAAAIIGAVLLIGSGVGSSSVYVYNGLGRPVVARLGEKRVDLPPFAHREVDVGQADRFHVITTTADGKPVEEFDAEMSGASSREVYNVASAGVMVSWVAVYGSAVTEPEHVLGAPRWSQTHAEIVFEQPPVSVRTKSGSATRDVLTGLSGEAPGYVLGLVKDDAARNALIATHARWDGGNTRYIQLWLGYAMSLPNIDEIIRKRLQDQPNDVFNLRMEQQLTSGAKHEAVCTRHRQLAAGAPEDANLQYIAARCIEDTDEQNRTFLDLHKRWPNNSWLALAAGYTFAEEAKWQDALLLIDHARGTLPGLAEPLAVESARLRRVLAGSGEANLRSLEEDSELLRALRAPEAPNGKETGLQHAYALLAQGHLEDALAEESNGSEVDRARLLRLVAASDGARPREVERAMGLAPDLGLDPDTLLPAMALAARSGRDPAPFIQLTPKMLGQEADHVLKVFALLRSGAGQAEVEQAIRGLDPQERGRLYVAAAILRGAACPPEWRTAARQLLFAPERPYLLSALVAENHSSKADPLNGVSKAELLRRASRIDLLSPGAKTELLAKPPDREHPKRTAPGLPPGWGAQ